jgi:hypothetical protein
MTNAKRLAIVRAGERSAAEVAARSRSALDAPLAFAGSLWVAQIPDDAVMLGAFQRATHGGAFAALPAHRRGSGGPTVRVGPGTLHVALSLAHPAALAGGDEKRIVNRSVRPLLRALTRAGHLASFFGRDWVSVQHRPVAWVGFSHDATTRRTVFEAFVAMRAPFAEGGASLLGKAPASLEELAGTAIDPRRIADAVVQAYGAAWDAEAVEASAPDLDVTDERAADDPPWAASVDEAIGTIGAGPDARGVFRVGGDLLVSRDALARLEARAATAPLEDVPSIVDETLAAPGVALDGVRSLTSVRDVIVRARGATAPRPSPP